MRILTVSHFYESHGGGIERVAAQLCREFTNAGHNATWAASDNDASPPDTTATSVPLQCIDPAERITGLPMPTPMPSGLRSLNQAIKAADAVIIHDALYLTSIAATVLGRRAGKPVLLIQHIAAIPFKTILLRGIMNLANRLITAPMLRAADHVVYISATTARAFAHISTVRSPIVLFNGVNAALFHDDASSDGDIRVRFGLPIDRKLLFFVGRFVEKKGLRIIAELARTRPDLTIVLAGQGPIDPLAWNCANVHVLGPRSPDEIAMLYRSADALLLPSVGEGYPLVIQEAMACGLPVICENESAAADPEAGQWLCGVAVDLASPNQSAKRVAAAVDSIAMSDEIRHDMSTWARSRYSWNNMAGVILSYFKPVNSHHNPPVLP